MALQTEIYDFTARRICNV